MILEWQYRSAHIVSLSYSLSLNTGAYLSYTLKEMRMKGLEPSRLAALEPKSSASTNSATSALALYSINKSSISVVKESNLGAKSRKHYD